MSGNKSRSKGLRGEYKARKMLIEAGHNVVWTSEDPLAPDLQVNGEGWEIKYQASIPIIFWQWLDEKKAKVLLVKRVRRGEKNDWLIIRRFKDVL